MDGADYTRMYMDIRSSNLNMCLGYKELEGESPTLLGLPSESETVLTGVACQCSAPCMHLHLLKYAGDAPQSPTCKRYPIDRECRRWRLTLALRPPIMRDRTAYATFRLHAITRLRVILAVAPSAHLIGII